MSDRAFHLAEIRDLIAENAGYPEALGGSYRIKITSPCGGATKWLSIDPGQVEKIVEALTETTPAATCPCGATDHVIADHPTAQVAAFHPVIGTYVMDDPIAEHRDGEHDAHPDPDSCAACAALGDG